MHSPLSAQIIVSITPNPEKSRVEYIVTTHEGECTGINQLAQDIQKSVMASLPKCAKPTGVKQ